MSINNPTEIRDRDLIYETKIAGKIPELIQRILRRKVISRQVQEAGINPTIAELQAAADKFRIVN